MATETTITRPAPFIEELGTELGRQITAQQGIPLVAQTVAGLGTGPTQRTGETDEQFKLRQDLFTKRQDAAQMFEDRQTSIGALAPQVAGQDALQQRAQSIAEAQAGQTGLAGFQPFLNQAQAQAGLASGLGTVSLAGLGLAGAELSQAGTTIGGVPTGAPTAAQTQQFMSPYQQQVIDATLTEFDRNRAIQEQSIRDQQAALGALGSGRAGVQLAEFGTGAARERALLQAGLLQQGFGQAQAARQQDIANRGALAAQQQGLGAFQAGLGQTQQAATGTDISRLGSLGALNQAQAQAQLDAQREAARQATFLPQEQLDRFAGQVTGIMGGYPAQFQSTITPNPTPLQTALGLGTTLAGIYGATRPGAKTTFSLT